MKLINMIGLVSLAMLISSTAWAAGDAGKGKQSYMANCIACHNPDPAKDGAVGPAIKGSSAELVKMRVLEAKYPAGYKPKRDTNLMPPLPHLAGNIDDLVAFLK